MEKLEIEEFVPGFEYELDMETVAAIACDYLYDGPDWVTRMVTNNTDMELVEVQLKTGLIRRK